MERGTVYLHCMFSLQLCEGYREVSLAVDCVRLDQNVSERVSSCHTACHIGSQHVGICQIVKSRVRSSSAMLNHLESYVDIVRSSHR